MPLEHKSTNDPHVAAHNEERDAINALELEVEARIEKPTTPHTGELLRFDGSNWVPSLTRLFEGTGSPNGVVAAPIGSRYVDTEADSGAIEWIKDSGLPTDNTGWILSAYADTGWRNISSFVDKRGTAVVNSAMLRRVNDTVDLYLDMKMPTNTASPWSVLTLPVGFRPSFSRYGAMQDNNEAAAASTRVTAGGVVELYTIVSAKTDRFNGTWTTTDAWPSVLPGI